MKHRFLWLLLPLSAWCGYRSAAGAAASGEDADLKEARIRLESSRTAQAAKAFEGATAQTLALRLQEILALPPGDEREMLTALLCARWAELDPAGALAYFAENKIPTYLRIRILTEWALLDSDAAWAALPAGTEGDQERAEVTAALLTEDRDVFFWWFRQTGSPYPDSNPAWLILAEEHPEEFARIAAECLEKAKEEPQSERGYAAKKFYELLAKLRAEKDPAAAIEWARSLDPSVRQDALRAALETQAKTDPLAVWKLINGPDKTLTDTGMTGIGPGCLGEKVFKQIARENPEAAMVLIREATDTNFLLMGALEAMQSVIGPALVKGEMNALDAYRLINSAKGSGSNLALNVFPSLWRGMSPAQLQQGARDILGEPADNYRGTALGGIAGAWFQQDPGAALTFISGIADAGLKAETYAGIFSNRNGMHVDPEVQASLLGKIPESDRAAVFATYLLKYGHPSSESNREISAAPEIHPELLAPLLGDLPPSPSLDQAVEVAAVKWGERDPAAALTWATKLNDPAARKSATAGALEGWSYHDPYAAGEWLAEQPEGPVRDAAAVPLVGHLARSRADVAWEWAGSIGDAGLRLDARATALRAWAGQDPDAARSAYREIAAKLSKADAAKLTACFSAP